MEWTAVESEQGFAAAVLQAVNQALEQRCRSITFCAAHFGYWPLSQPELLTALSAFARLPGRQLTLLSRDFDVVRRQHPRFVDWRQTWAHAIDARRPVDDGLNLPTVVLADRLLALELTDPDNWVGVWRTTALDRQATIETVESLMRRTEAAFPVNVLGL